MHGASSNLFIECNIKIDTLTEESISPSTREKNLKMKRPRV